MSDLLTSALHDGKDSYLCGYPLRSAGRYVLARTWLAPELPRPGCVWTHSLVLDNQAIASASSMWDVMDLHRRPRDNDVSGYTARTSVCCVTSRPCPSLNHRQSPSRLTERARSWTCCTELPIGG